MSGAEITDPPGSAIMKQYFRGFLFVIFGIAAVDAVAQTARPAYDRQADFDVQHYAIRVSFDHPRRTVIGDTTVRLRPTVASLRNVRLDAVGLGFTRVENAETGKPLRYTAARGNVSVTLDRAYGPDEEVSLRFRYTTRPQKGVYFVNERRDQGRRVHSDQIWTQGQPDEARHWFPSFDHPEDKATTEKFITAKKGQTVIGNGELMEAKENPDGTVTHHFRMDIPHSTYLVSFVIGEYEKVEEKFGEIPLGYYIYPGSASLVPLAYVKTTEMLKIMEELTSVAYPFNKYDQTMVANFEFGGMENITATTMSDTEIAYARLDFLRGNVEDLVAHEIAHSWFGNNVTCANWAELYLNEAFATFFEAAIREKMYGREDYMRKIMLDAEAFINHDSTTPVSHGLYNRRAADTSILFRWPAVTYNKGGAVVHQLREQIGDKAFWKALNTILTRHRFSSIRTPDLRSAMEEASGQNLGWFFDQWIYGTGYPKLTIRYRYDRDAGEMRLNIEQTQRGDRLTPAGFRLPLEIEFLGKDGSRIRRIADIKSRREIITIPLDTTPDEMNIDPDEKIPLKAIRLLETK